MKSKENTRKTIDVLLAGAGSVEVEANLMRAQATLGAHLGFQYDGGA